MTQRMIADMAGVSQSTVSLVLNGKADATRRIPAETRDRVLEVIRETTYVANPVARSLAGVSNNLIGVFTYEHAFPNDSTDFYTPLLTGVESAAEHLGADLLMFTSTPVLDGRRHLFHESSRLRLADGCLLLGREMDADDLARLVDSGYPFVAIGRRDAAAGRVPYVGVDYVSAAQALATLAVEAGHTRFASLHLSLTAESTTDRREGLLRGLAGHGALTELLAPEAGLDGAWRRVRESGATVLFVEDPLDAQKIHDFAVRDGVTVPDDLSLVVLGEHSRPRERAVDFTRLSAPRTALGSRAVALLDEVMNGSRGAAPLPRQQLLESSIVGGSTLSRPRAL
ncbi:LacI family transcriptional regulator [Frondihabitans sucicola]|uniref:LacI family transcriptional regulator n=1 Tax=Frondihabitans sucicola TaxID=1268041 RepID=A0ABN6XZ36_9MICO|nr:LacI family transcriptional regulator [Frondihabitans sucicola]